MDPSESSDANIEIETSDNNPSNPSETAAIQTPADSISTEGNPAVDSVPPSDPPKGDSNALDEGDSSVLDDSEKGMQPQVLTPPDEADPSDVIAGIDNETSAQEQESVQISISSEKSNKPNPDSLLGIVPSEEPEDRDNVAVSIQEGARSPISPSRSSLSSRGSRAKQRKRVSFNEKREGKAPFIPTWPRCDGFTAVAGEEAVQRHVQESWKLDESWLHCVDYLGEEPPSSGRHSYRVKFSQPTRRRPVPAHTASVYFTLAAAAGCEGAGLVQVWWVLEGQRLVHRPGEGEGEFREQWLRDILEAKAIICSETLF